MHMETTDKANDLVRDRRDAEISTVIDFSSPGGLQNERDKREVIQDSMNECAQFYTDRNVELLKSSL